MAMSPERFNRTLATALTLAAMTLAGCASGRSIEAVSADTFALDCSGGAPTWAGCHALAEKACDGGRFEIQSQVSNEGSAGVGTNDWSTAGSQITRTMVVKCK
jgi:hypothetical protein